MQKHLKPYKFWMFLGKRKMYEEKYEQTSIKWQPEKDLAIKETNYSQKWKKLTRTWNVT